MLSDREWSQWLDYHAAAFPKVGAFLQKSPGTQRFWHKALGRYSLDALRHATDQMNSGEAEVPKWAEDHKDAVRELAGAFAVHSARRDKPNGPKLVELPDGTREWAYACPTCQDQRFAIIFHPEALREYHKNPPAFVPRTWRCAIKCSCEQAARFVNTYLAEKKLPTPVYDPTIHLLWDWDRTRFSDEREGLIDRLVNFRRHLADPGSEMTTDDFADYAAQY